MEEGPRVTYVPAQQVTSYTECSHFTITIGVLSCIGMIALYVMNGELQRIITLGSGSPVYFVIWTAHAIQSIVLVPVVCYIIVMKHRNKFSGQPQPPRRANTEAFQPSAYNEMRMELHRNRLTHMNTATSILADAAPKLLDETTATEDATGSSNCCFDNIEKALSLLGLDSWIQECVNYPTLGVAVKKMAYLAVLYMGNAYAWSLSLDQPDMSVGIVTALFNTTPIWVFLLCWFLDVYARVRLRRMMRAQVEALHGEGEEEEEEAAINDDVAPPLARRAATRQHTSASSSGPKDDRCPEVGIQMVAIAIAMVGVTLLSYTSEPARDFGLGIVLVLLASALYSAYEVFYKRDLLNNHSSVPLTFVLFAVGVMGLVDLLFLWWLVPVLHWIGVETFVWPTKKQWVWLCINGSCLTLFQLCLQMSLCFLPSPLLVSLASLLTMPAAQIADWFLRTGDLTGPAILGSVFIAISFVIMVVLEVAKAGEASKQLAEYKRFFEQRRLVACYEVSPQAAEEGETLNIFNSDGDDDDGVVFSEEDDYGYEDRLKKSKSDASCRSKRPPRTTSTTTTMATGMSQYMEMSSINSDRSSSYVDTFVRLLERTPSVDAPVQSYHSPSPSSKNKTSLLQTTYNTNVPP